MLKDELAKLGCRINAVIGESGRNPKDIKIVLVTKTVSPERIREVYDLGFRSFGENKAQEFLSKCDVLPNDIHWHFVGHLQTNKIKYIIDKVHLIHSVDSVRLAVEIGKSAAKIGKIQDVLVQINTSGEDSKSGKGPEEAEGLLEAISKVANVRVLGLMTIGPFTDNEEQIKAAFGILHDLRDKYLSKYLNGVGLLSMGMSSDFEIAIREGANILRIGSLVFGQRA